MVQGDHISPGRSAFDRMPSIPYSFQDLTYDGQFVGSTNRLINGLGQLMDNIAYLDNITSISDSHPNHPGYHFIGWKLRSKKLDIVFKFDRGSHLFWYFEKKNNSN